jgi:hypothetical protein
LAPGTPLRPGQIYESNAFMLAAAVRDAGAQVVASPMTGDDVDQFRAEVRDLSPSRSVPFPSFAKARSSCVPSEEHQPISHRIKSSGGGFDKNRETRMMRKTLEP